MLCIVPIVHVESPYSYTDITIIVCGHSVVWCNVGAYYRHMFGAYTKYRVWVPHIYVYMCLTHRMLRWGPVVWGPHIYMDSVYNMLCWDSIVWGPHISTYMGLTHSMLWWGLRLGIVWGPHIYIWGPCTVSYAGTL